MKDVYYIYIQIARSCLMAIRAVLCLYVTISSPIYSYDQNHLNQLNTTKACPGCDLSGITTNKITPGALRGAYLEGANFSGSNLSNADFSQSSLTGSNIKNSFWWTNVYTKDGYLQHPTVIWLTGGSNRTGQNLEGALSNTHYYPDQAHKVEFKKGLFRTLNNKFKNDPNIITYSQGSRPNHLSFLQNLFTQDERRDETGYLRIARIIVNAYLGGSNPLTSIHKEFETLNSVLSSKTNSYQNPDIIVLGQDKIKNANLAYGTFPGQTEEKTFYLKEGLPKSGYISLYYHQLNACNNPSNPMPLYKWDSQSNRLVEINKTGHQRCCYVVTLEYDNLTFDTITITNAAKDTGFKVRGVYASNQNGSPTGGEFALAPVDHQNISDVCTNVGYQVDATQSAPNITTPVRLRLVNEADSNFVVHLGIRPKYEKNSFPIAQYFWDIFLRSQLESMGAINSSFNNWNSSRTISEEKRLLAQAMQPLTFMFPSGLPQYLSPLIQTTINGNEQVIIDMSEYINNMPTNLSGANFTGATLNSTHFNGSELRGTNFSNVQAPNSQFNYTFQSGTNFSGATLTNAQFKEAFIYNTNFTKAQLTNALFERALIGYGGFVDANLLGTQFHGTTFTNHIGIRNSNNSPVNLSKTQLWRAYLRGTDWSSINLNMKETSFMDPSFHNICYPYYNQGFGLTQEAQ